MSTIEARTFTSSADMIAAARNVRNRLWKPKNAKLDKPIGLATNRSAHDSAKPDIPKTFTKRGKNKAEDAAYEYAVARCNEMNLPVAVITERPRTNALERSRMDLFVEVYLKFDKLTMVALAELFCVNPSTASRAIRGSGHKVRQRPVRTVAYKDYQDFMPTGYKGISKCRKNNRFRARLSLREKTLNCGYYDTLEEAIAARHAKMIEYGREPN